MKFKQAYVTREKLDNIFYIIEDTLSSEPNTQVFIDGKIYKWLNSRIYTPNISIHDYDSGSKGFYLHDEKNKVFIYASFVPNAKECMQLARFCSYKVGRYRKNLARFNQLLLILAKPNE